MLVLSGYSHCTVAHCPNNISSLLKLFMHFISVLQVTKTTLVGREATHSLPPGNPSRAQRIPINAGPAPHWAKSGAEPCQGDFPSGYLSVHGVFASCGCPPWSAQPASQLWPRVKQPPGRPPRTLLFLLRWVGSSMRPPQLLLLWFTVS